MHNDEAHGQIITVTIRLTFHVLLSGLAQSLIRQSWKSDYTIINGAKREPSIDKMQRGVKLASSLVLACQSVNWDDSQVNFAPQC